MTKQNMSFKSFYYFSSVAINRTSLNLISKNDSLENFYPKLDNGSLKSFFLKKVVLILLDRLLMKEILVLTETESFRKS